MPPMMLARRRRGGGPARRPGGRRLRRWRTRRPAAADTVLVGDSVAWSIVVAGFDKWNRAPARATFHRHPHLVRLPDRRPRPVDPDRAGGRHVARLRHLGTRPAPRLPLGRPDAVVSSWAWATWAAARSTAVASSWATPSTTSGSEEATHLADTLASSGARWCGSPTPDVRIPDPDDPTADPTSPRSTTRPGRGPQRAGARGRPAAHPPGRPQRLGPLVAGGQWQRDSRRRALHAGRLGAGAAACRRPCRHHGDPLPTPPVGPG